MTSKSSRTNFDASQANDIEAIIAGIAIKRPSGCCVERPQRKYCRGRNPRPIVVPKAITAIGEARLIRPPYNLSEEAMKENASP